MFAFTAGPRIFAPHLVAICHVKFQQSNGIPAVSTCNRALWQQQVSRSVHAGELARWR